MTNPIIEALLIEREAIRRDATEAFLAGRTAIDNPHPADDQTYLVWFDAWCRAAEIAETGTPPPHSPEEQRRWALSELAMVAEKVFRDSLMVKAMDATLCGGAEERDSILRLAELARAAHKLVGDDCQVCEGARGGLLGNENIVGGIRMCDFCTIDYMDERDTSANK